MKLIPMNIRKEHFVILFFVIVLSIWIYKVYLSSSNVRFYIADESDIISNTDISIFIDDRIIIEDSIYQSPKWIIGKSYQNKLSPGIYNLEVKSSKFNYSLKKGIYIFYTHTIFIHLNNPDASKLENFKIIDGIFSISTKIGKGIII